MTHQSAAHKPNFLRMKLIGELAWTVRHCIASLDVVIHKDIFTAVQ